MKQRFMVVAAAMALFVFGSAMGAENLKSGPQVGEEIPGAFHPLNITGDSAGHAHCLVCENGSHPVAMVFARDVSQPLASLVKKLDEATDQHKDAKMGSFVVVCSADEDAITKELKGLAESQGIQHTVLSLWDDQNGPPDYKVAKEADVTVVLYTKMQVKANYAFKKGELKDDDIDRIVKDISKILPDRG